MAAPTETPALTAGFDDWMDFDREDIYERVQPHVLAQNSKNFIVEFGAEMARIDFDVGADRLQKILEEERTLPTYPVRWINIWDPAAQSEAIKAIGSKYEFSDRLIQLMLFVKQGAKEATTKDKSSQGLRHRRPKQDPEKGDDVVVDAPTPASESTTAAPPGMIKFDELDPDIKLYLQLKNTVSYFSTDLTKKALCIGAHWLHERPKRERQPPRRSMVPPKHWQWLVLCNDHTVISIHDPLSFDPCPAGEDLSAWEAEELKNIRGNVLGVLQQLSQLGYEKYSKQILRYKKIREPLKRMDSSHPDLARQETNKSDFGEPGNLADEGTSNLFYYLFEDYVAAGPLRTAERTLAHVTHKVMESARTERIRNKRSDIIPTLHHLSKDLRELKHLFENYKNLIGKIMASKRLSGGLTEDRLVLLADSAMSRFERLSDRLQLLMLNTIEGYLEEISALSNTFFNLTQQKDSEATARLTRSATLLAKLSVFFLPISFVTSYFSIQIEDLYVYWTGTDYWYSFAVVASVSFVSLFFFSRLLMFFSDVMDDWSLGIARAANKLGRKCGLNLPNDDDDDDDGDGDDEARRKAA
ncbi:hypothetical protein F4780DRAFT_774817 [Xylariomycetidae sp. FL0641]|nr:hypothetical protein F4780DRAFT_774817 [Xylariomycetidae sp. FL0641]